tara:strand:- start:200 stop:550 length:351 start_codon:yes stop_codon:yes gene_type:complete
MNKKILYFIFLCFPARLLLATIAKILKPKYLPIMSIFTIFISISFLINFIKYKKDDKGFFGSYVWWNNYRLIHSFTYAIFSIQALMNYNKAWIVLLIDAILGLIFFINKYFIDSKK